MGKEALGQGRRGLGVGGQGETKTRGSTAGPGGAAQQSFLDFCHEVQMSPLRKLHLTSGLGEAPPCLHLPCPSSATLVVS